MLHSSTLNYLKNIHRGLRRTGAPFEVRANLQIQSRGYNVNFTSPFHQSQTTIEDSTIVRNSSSFSIYPSFWLRLSLAGYTFARGQVLRTKSLL